MKKVTNNPPVDEISVDKASTKKYYGVQMSESRGIVTANNWGSNFTVRSIYDFTNGNLYDGYLPTTTLQRLLRDLIKDNKEIFEFDTFVELAKWAEDGQP